MSEAYEQTFESGKRVPSNFYSNISIKTRRDRQASIRELKNFGMPLTMAHRKTLAEKDPDDVLILESSIPGLVGHTRNCDYVRSIISISHILLRNCYVHSGDDRMGSTKRVVPDIVPCDCGRPGGIKELEVGKHRVFNYPEHTSDITEPRYTAGGTSEIPASSTIYAQQGYTAYVRPVELHVKACKGTNTRIEVEIVQNKTHYGVELTLEEADLFISELARVRKSLR